MQRRVTALMVPRKYEVRVPGCPFHVIQKVFKFKLINKAQGLSKNRLLRTQVEYTHLYLIFRADTMYWFSCDKLLLTFSTLGSEMVDKMTRDWILD